MESIQPLQPSKPGGPDSDKEQLQQIQSAPVRTLDDVKQLLIGSLGYDKGMKFYNNFLATIVLEGMALQRSAAARAQQAAKKLGQTGQ